MRTMIRLMVIAVMYAVLASAMPALASSAADDGGHAGSFVRPPEGPIIYYKGRKLIGAGYANVNNDAFFKVVKLTIDMVDELPGRLRRIAGEVKEIIYDPPHPLRKTKGNHTRLVVAYVVEDKKRAPAPAVLFQEVTSIPNYVLAGSLLANGMHARWHKRELDLSKQLIKAYQHKDKWTPDDLAKTKALLKEYNDLRAYQEKTDLDIAQRYRCATFLLRHEAYDAWRVGYGKLNELAGLIEQHKCRENGADDLLN